MPNTTATEEKFWITLQSRNSHTQTFILTSFITVNDVKAHNIQGCKTPQESVFAENMQIVKKFPLKMVLEIQTKTVMMANKYNTIEMKRVTGRFEKI